MTVPARPLCVIPSFLRTPQDLEILVRCMVSLWGTASAPDTIVVDDGSPAPELVEMLAAACAEVDFELVAKPENEGFARTVNVGLRRALAEGRDAVLINADVLFTDHGWLDRLLARTDTAGRPAAVVGARLLYPNGCLQHAGVFFSQLARSWWHRFQYAPGDLPAALHPARCPVTAALQLIRHDTLEQVGVYDEGFRMGYEDVDYCLRVFAAGLECMYEPGACAVHHESLFRTRGHADAKLKSWHDESAARLLAKWGHADFSPFTPEIA